MDGGCALESDSGHERVRCKPNNAAVAHAAPEPGATLIPFTAPCTNTQRDVVGRSIKMPAPEELSVGGVNPYATTCGRRIPQSEPFSIWTPPEPLGIIGFENKARF
jgi:hypothetical protein